MESGDYDLATKEKARLEEAQRARRKENEHLGINHNPIYFENAGNDEWRFNGHYWKDRACKNWPKALPIFD